MSSSVHIDVKQMIDLALGTPELGIVNFNLLHSLLHIIAKQLDILETKIELRGDDNDIIKSLVESDHRGTTVEITEYVVDKSVKKTKSKKIPSKKSIVSQESVPQISAKSSKKAPQEKVIPEQEEKIIIEEEKIIPEQEKIIVSKQEENIIPVQEEEIEQVTGKPSLHEEDKAEEIEEITRKESPVSLPQQKSTSEVHEDINDKASFHEEVLPDIPKTISNTTPSHSSQKTVDEVVEKESKSSTILVVDRKESQSSKHTTSSVSSDDLTQDEDQNTTVISKKSKEKPTRVSLVTFSQHTMLEERVSSLQEQLSQTLPENKEVIAAVRSQSSTKSISDMWKLLSVSSRVEATETGISKLSSIVGDLAMEYEKVSSKIGLPSPTSIVTTHSNEDDISDFLSSEKTSEGSQKDKSITESPSIFELINELSKEFQTLKDDVKELNILWTQAQKISEETKNTFDTSQEGRIRAITEELSRLDGSINNQMNIFQDQMSDVEKEMTNFWKNLNELNINTNISDDIPAKNIGIGFDEYQSRIRAFQDDIKSINREVATLLEEKDDRSQHINELYEEIDVLRKMKADKADLNDALEEKADLSLVNNKVSNNRFDGMVEYLAKRLADTHSQLEIKEATWQSALTEIHNEIENKSDKNQVQSLRSVIDKKIEKIQEKLKILSDIKEEREAAGTKFKYLRDVNCISCDNNVIMPKFQNTPNFPLFKPMTCNPPNNPCTAYELSNIRKFQRCHPCQHDFNFWQVKQMKSDSGKSPRQGMHLSNRYCGGSHTVTTPQQRLLRKGNFNDQWAVEEPSTKYDYDEKVMRVDSEKNFQKTVDPIVNQATSTGQDKAIEKKTGTSTVVTNETNQEKNSSNNRNLSRVSLTKSLKKKNSTILKPQIPEHRYSKTMDPTNDKSETTRATTDAKQSVPDTSQNMVSQNIINTDSINPPPNPESQPDPNNHNHSNQKLSSDIAPDHEQLT